MATKVFRVSGVGAMNVRCKLGGVNPLGDIAEEQIAISELRLHLSAATGTAEDLVLSQDSALGVEYDAAFKTQAMNGLQDLNYQPTRPHVVAGGDDVTVTWSNSNARTWGLEIVYEASI